MLTRTNFDKWVVSKLDVQLAEQMLLEGEQAAGKGVEAISALISQASNVQELKVLADKLGEHMSPDQLVSLCGKAPKLAQVGTGSAGALGGRGELVALILEGASAPSQHVRCHDRNMIVMQNECNCNLLLPIYTHAPAGPTAGRHCPPLRGRKHEAAATQPEQPEHRPAGDTSRCPRQGRLQQRTRLPCQQPHTGGFGCVIMLWCSSRPWSAWCVELGRWRRLVCSWGCSLDNQISMGAVSPASVKDLPPALLPASPQALQGPQHLNSATPGQLSVLLSAAVGLGLHRSGRGGLWSALSAAATSAVPHMELRDLARVGGAGGVDVDWGALLKMVGRWAVPMDAFRAGHAQALRWW